MRDKRKCLQLDLDWAEISPSLQMHIVGAGIKLISRALQVETTVIPCPKSCVLFGNLPGSVKREAYLCEDKAVVLGTLGASCSGSDKDDDNNVF
jgi:hypothetical protein